MKKISILAVAFALAGLGAQAQDNPTSQPQQQTMQQEQGQQNKQQVKPEELPDAVKLAVANSDYKEWTLGEVYLIQPTEDGAPVVYEVQFLNGEEEPVVVRYDEAGKEVNG
ncbi:hypothetical protein [Pontibacter actiniarum]|uniref:PepSY domain-containing protein n=1 Tax=Pontibacter actiniarum TaxID=323450 RepID=A0A1X9YVF1_9BACT|nr:hypothetical protein [Pontibacter actiniarum]ARS36900.1 hypothetical protein CA264_16525 [Pontibacter actiniarum]